MRARYYNPQIQRFINVDPVRDGYNWYLYTNDSPIINIDPSGEVAFIIPAVAVAIGAVAGTAAYQVYSNVNRSYRRTVRNYYTPSVSNQYVSENNIDRRIPGYRQLQETLRSTILSTPQDRANALFESVLGYPADAFAQKVIIDTVPTAIEINAIIGRLKTISEENLDDFEESLNKLPANERVAKVKEKAQKVAKEKGLVKDAKLSRINGRDIYRDPKSGDYYSVDTQHGRFEHLNKRGKHLGEVDFEFNNTKPADISGGHDINIG